MKKGLVSVIIPTKNRAQYLAQAIDSVYAQNYPDFEIIIVDDGSTDNTRDIATSYDAKLRYIHQVQQGASVARNCGIAKAEGEYIAFLDDDDIYMPEKLQANVDYLTHHPDVVWLCSGFAFIDAEGSFLPRDPIVPAQSSVTLHDIAMFMFISTPSVMVRKYAIEMAGGFPEGVRVSEDYHAWAKILALGKGAALQQVLVCFRQHDHNTKFSTSLLLKENTRIIDCILANNTTDLLPRSSYIQNLHRIIRENLSYKGKYMEYLYFILMHGEEALFQRIRLCMKYFRKVFPL